MNDRPRVVLTADLPGPALERLRARADVVVGATRGGIAAADVLAALPGARALVTLLSDRVDAALLDRAPSLALVANYAVGFDNVDLAACRARGVAVTNTPGVLTDATADLAMALLLDACRRVSESDRVARAGRWTGFGPFEFLGKAVTGATLGVVGFGRIGQAVARRARGFSMRVVYHQRTRLAPDLERELGASFVELDELFRASDVVSLHCPLTPETRGIVSRERLATMKRGAVLVNTARGACVDAVALADALHEGRLGGAGLDVFENEPNVPRELRDLERVVLTTHVGSADEPTRARMAEMCVECVEAVLDGREPPRRVA